MARARLRRRLCDRDAVRAVKRVGLFTWRRTLWHAAKARKIHRCLRCENEIGKGEEMFRPMSEVGNVARYNRVCLKCGQNIDAHGGTIKLIE